jgi:hypothetical protein
VECNSQSGSYEDGFCWNWETLFKILAFLAKP